MDNDKCLKCGEFGMPKIHNGSMATARACRNCGWIEELGTQLEDKKDTQFDTAKG